MALLGRFLRIGALAALGGFTLACGSDSHASAPASGAPSPTPESPQGGEETPPAETNPTTLTVSTGAPSVAVKRGGRASLPVSVTRSAPKVVRLEVFGLPTGLTCAPVTVPADATTATLELTATGDATLGVTQLTLTAKTDDGGAADSALEALVYAGEQLDPSFGAGGVVVHTTGMRSFMGRELAVLSDGKIVVGGAFDSYGAQAKPVAGFLRFLPSGAVDAAFGDSGALVPSPASFGSYDKTILGGVRADGTGGFYAVATAYASDERDVVLFHVGASGDLDPSFGTAGLVTIDLGAADADAALGRDASGRLLVASTVETASGRDAVISRFSASGQLDATYGTAGRVTTTFGGERPYGLGVETAGDALVVRGSRYQVGEQVVHGFVARLTSAGALDAAFGDGGTYDNTYDVFALSVAADARTYVAGNYAVRRLSSSGALDAGFGASGTVSTDTLDNVPLAALDGRSYNLQSKSNSKLTLTSLTSGGVVDASFASTGSIVVETPMPIGTLTAEALVYTPDGRAVALGNGFGAKGRIVVARFLL